MLESHYLDGVVEMVDEPLDRRRLAHDERERHQPEYPAAHCESAQLTVGEVPRVVAERATAGVADEHVPRAFHRLGERGLGRVSEVENHPTLAERVDELAAAIREALRGRVDPAGKVVREVPREPDHSDAEVPEVRQRGWISLERLDSFHRQQEPDPPVRADPTEVGARPDLEDIVLVLPERAVQLGGLFERSLARPSLVGRIERAHLEPDAACAKLRQPVPRERIRLVPAEDELEREVVVGVRDQRRTYVPTRRAAARTLPRRSARSNACGPAPAASRSGPRSA